MRTFQAQFPTLLLFLFADASAFTGHKRLTHGASRPSVLTRGSTPLYYRDQLADSSIAAPTLTRRVANEFDDSNVSMPLINAIWSSQASILVLATALVAGISVFSGNPFGLSSLHWNESPSFHSLFYFEPTLWRLVEGVLAAIPLVALGCAVEQSDARDASHVNFSTTNMVISLFGRRRSVSEPTATSSSLVMMLSALIALSTGISEEIVFRGYIPSALDSLTHSIPLALASSAGLFAIGHISRKSTPGENTVVGGLQFANGIWYGLVYLIAGGDILPGIVAHTLYDMHVLCETWSSINSQMDYTQDAFQQRLDEEEENAIQRIQQQAGPSLNMDTLNFARRFFYAFDHEHKGSLSLSDVQRAVTYAFLKKNVVPEPEWVEKVFEKLITSRNDSNRTPADRLSVSEFLRLLFTLKSQGSAARA
jgi:membrane protease YdiL (CAAX protease family)